MKKKSNIVACMLVGSSVIAFILVICYIVKCTTKKMIDMINGEPIGI